MSDRISIRNLVVFGRHGYHAEERRLGQRFEVDITVETDFRPATAHDDLTRTINYGALAEAVSEVASGQWAYLIETVAERIAARVLADFPLVNTVHVAVRKPNAPVAAVFDTVEVAITRRRG